MLVVASEKFHSYIFGRRFTVASDHKTHAMILLNNLPAAIPRLQRMQLRIQRYDMTIKNKPGTEMLLADLMPRLNPLPSKESLNLQKVCLVQFSDARPDTLRQEASSDTEFSAVRETIYFGWPEKQKQVPAHLRKYWAYRDELSIENGLILKGNREIIPKSQR